MIDLRSDTITTPSPDMRRAMADAVVGDDVYGDDPTVRALEERVADLLGKDDAMYVPTGTMSNQIAIRLHTQPGDMVIAERGAHIGIHELGGPAHHSGVTLHHLDGTHGVFTGEQVSDAVPDPHPSMPAHLYEPHTLMCVENTHNAAGGTVWNLGQVAAVCDAASKHGLAKHLDGARLWNASVATGSAVSEFAAHFDTVSVCFSKGLGAPVGSALVGARDLITEARRFKQLFGGGFRQAGIIAAGALFAVDHNRERLAVDHAHAQRFAEAVAAAPGAAVDLPSVQTNIVYFDVPDPRSVVDMSGANGVAMLVLGATRIRAVFHLDVTDDDTSKAIDIVTAAIGA